MEKSHFMNLNPPTRDHLSSFRSTDVQSYDSKTKILPTYYKSFNQSQDSISWNFSNMAERNIYSNFRRTVVRLNASVMEEAQMVKIQVR